MRHGTRRSYGDGCRCLPCAVAESRYKAMWYRGERARVPAEVVRAHLEELVASGWTRVGIARAAGVGVTTPASVLNGRVRRVTDSDAPQMVNSGTAAALLAVPPLTEGGIRAHLRRLVKSGLTTAEIGAEAGIPEWTVKLHLWGRRQEVRQATATALAAVEPLEPPVELDPAPLLEAVRNRMSLLDRTDQRALYRARREGRISEEIADRIAIRAGVGPLPLLYPYEEAA